MKIIFILALFILFVSLACSTAGGNEPECGGVDLYCPGDEPIFHKDLEDLLNSGRYPQEVRNEVHFSNV